MELEYVLADPTGNGTVLVKTSVAAARQPTLAGLLLAAEPEAEQVGFLSRPGLSAVADTALRMAGGEFCGNATMRAAALWCEERALARAAVRVRVSAAAKPVRVRVERTPDGGYAAEETMPLPTAVGEAALTLDGAAYRLPLLRFPGIAHLILPGGFDRALAARAAPAWCAALNAPALGLMLLDEAAGRMTPLVWVAAGETLYWEHSCASGTAAAGVYCARRAGAETTLSLTQPGGTLCVTASPDGPILLRGGVKLLRSGRLQV